MAAPDDDYLYSGLFEPTDVKQEVHGQSVSHVPMEYGDMKPKRHAGYSLESEPRSKRAPSPDMRKYGTDRRDDRRDERRDERRDDRRLKRSRSREYNNYNRSRSRERAPPPSDFKRSRSGEREYRRSRSRSVGYARRSRSRSQSRDFTRRKKYVPHPSRTPHTAHGAQTHGAHVDVDLEVECDEHLRKGLGSLWDDWQKHRHLCAMSQTRFIRHLLSLHKKFCVSRPNLADCGTQFDVHDQQLAVTPGPGFSTAPRAGFLPPSTPTGPAPGYGQTYNTTWNSQPPIYNQPTAAAPFVQPPPAGTYGAAYPGMPPTNTNMFTSPPPMQGPPRMNPPYAQTPGTPQPNAAFMQQSNVRFPGGSPQTGSFTGQNVPPGAHVSSPQNQQSMSMPQHSTYISTSKNMMVRSFEQGQLPFITLNEIRENVVDFAMSQQGAKFLQEKLPSATAQQLTFVYTEVMMCVGRPKTLMMNPFGNYFIQCLLDFGTDDQRNDLARSVLGSVNELANSKNGNRVVQKVFDCAPPLLKVDVANELRGTVISLAKGYNGGFVIQKCINSVDSQHLQFIADEVRGQEVTLSLDSQGCRVMQAIIERFHVPQKQAIIASLLQSIEQLATDKFGNYIVQHIMRYGQPHEKNAIIMALKEKVVQFGRNKFASNVIENCLADTGPHERALLIDEVCAMSDGDLIGMIQDSYGNYVIGKMLDVADPPQRHELMMRIRPHIQVLQANKQSHKVVSKVQTFLDSTNR